MEIAISEMKKGGLLPNPQWSCPTEVFFPNPIFHQKPSPGLKTNSGSGGVSTGLVI
jgi:hypothetical protein